MIYLIIICCKLIYEKIKNKNWEQVGSSQRKERMDYAIESIHNIKQVLPELWELANNKEDINKFISCKMALETTITA